MLIAYLEAGEPLSEFLEDFSTVSKALAITAQLAAPVYRRLQPSVGSSRGVTVRAMK